MEFSYLKQQQWRNTNESVEEQDNNNANNNNEQHAENEKLPPPPPHVLPLFTLTSSQDDSSTINKFHMGMEHNNNMSSSSTSNYNFSMSQWQELELQALIYRHMISGATIPNQLLHHMLLVKKNNMPTSSSSASPYSNYLLNHSLHNFYPNLDHYQSPPQVQSGYWGKGAMDPEPGRCRRTDGKKWRCSRDVVIGNKYCERHMHRGKNRSRKPVEIPPTPYRGNRGTGNGALKTIKSVTTQGVLAGGGSGGDIPHFTLSRPSDPNQPSLRPSNFSIETIDPFGAKGEPSGRTLQHFFDDWPRTLHETENSANSTNLSISMPGNPPSDFSLTLGTSSGDDAITEVGGHERGKSHLNWGTSAWETTRVGSLGGPLAEALRSSTSTSSPTSVLHRLARGSVASEASYGST